MALIKFFIERYDLKNFFLFEIQLFYKIKNYLYFFFYKYHHPISLFIQVFEFLILYFFFYKSGNYIFLNLYYYSLFCKIFVSFNFSYVDSVYELLTFQFVKKFFFLKFQLLVLKFKIFFFKFLRYYIKLRELFLIYAIFNKFFNYFAKLSLLLIVLCKIKFYKLKKFFFIEYFIDSLFFKFFFNFFESSDVSYFIYLLNNFFNYYLINRIVFIHYKFMSVPAINRDGSVSIRWLAYCAWVRLYFFAIRKSYHSDIEKHFQARYYYRERTFLSYIKNFIYLFSFFIKSIIFFFKKIWYAILGSGSKFNKNFSVFSVIKFFLKKFLITRKSSFSSLLIFFKRFFVTILFLNIYWLLHTSVWFIFPFFSQIISKFLKVLFFLFPFIKIFFYKLKLKIYDRVWYVPKFISFGRGATFKKRFSFEDFYFVPNFLYWYKKFTKRFQIFMSIKKFVIRKRYAGFRITFKIFFFIIKYSFVFVKYIFFSLIYCFYWYFLADICFVL